MTDDRRASQRLSFDTEEGPTLIVEEQGHRVVDCGSGGLRYEVDPQHRPRVGAAIVGVLRIPTIDDIHISGCVVWTTNTTAALQLDDDEAVPMDQLVEALGE